MEYGPAGILLITGTVGVGKTTVATEIGEQLADMNLPNAVIDLDWFGWVNVGNDFKGYDQLIAQNITATWQNYHSAGVKYLVLARGLLHRELVTVLENAFPKTSIIIVRLAASKDTIEKRLSQRDKGETLREHLDEVDTMNRVMDELHLESVSINNDKLSVEETAQQIIASTHWKP